MYFYVYVSKVYTDITIKTYIYHEGVFCDLICGIDYSNIVLILV